MDAACAHGGAAWARMGPRGLRTLTAADASAYGPPVSETPQAPHDPSLEGALRRTLQPWTRRRVIVGAGLAGLTVLLGFRACAPRVSTEARPGLPSLTGTQLAIFERLFALMIPTRLGALVPVANVPVLANADAAVARLTPEVRLLLQRAMLAFDLGAIVTSGEGTRFINLGDDAAAAYLSQWQHGGEIRRAAYGGMRQVVMLSYYSDPAAWVPLSYDGPVTESRGIVRLGHAPLPEV